MATIHIETNLIAVKEYEFIQTVVVGEINVEERLFQEQHEDRMYAAMTNLGYACRWFADKNESRGSVCIVTDTDGKDKRYSGEHDDLFEAIRSQREYQKNRAKYALIYGKYVKFLDRIRELANSYEIGFTQNDKPVNEIRCGMREFVKADTEYIADYSNNPYFNGAWTRDNIIRLSMSGRHNTVTCNACQRSIQYLQTDEFPTFRHQYLLQGKWRNVTVKNNKQLVKIFQDEHLGLHTDNDKKT